MLTKLAAVICCLGTWAGYTSAAENLRGEIALLLPSNLTLYGQAKDASNTSNNTFQVKVCWDDPTFTNNCDTPIIANTFGFPYINSCGTAPCLGFNYVIPVGTVGSVNPRDGNTHLMYLKVISQANPGAGDKIVDGSPWPFTYRNGTAAQMWPANLEAQPSRLGAAQLAVIANSQDPYSVGSAGNVVCTAGSTAIKDDGVVGYYVLKHNVPCSNVYAVSLQVTPAISLPTFNSAVLPTLQALPPTIQAIALGWAQPSVVFNQSISSVVAKAGPVTGTTCFDSGSGLSAGPINPYFNSTSQAPYTDFQLRPTMMLAGESCPTCTSTNNYGFPWLADISVARSFIDAAVGGANTNPPGGNVYWAWTGDLGRSITALIASPATFGNALSPLVNAQVLGSLSSPTSAVVSQKNILVYDEGAAHWLYNNPGFVSGGGIGFAVTSTSGLLPYDGNQTNAASWLYYGAVAAFGNAVEPCGLFPYKSPDPALIVPFYTQGQTAIEALWKSVRLPWQGNFVGDPLAAPYSLPASSTAPAPVLSSISPNSGYPGASVTVTITGSNFTAPLNLTTQSSLATIGNVTVVNSTTLTAVLQLTPTLTGTSPQSFTLTASTAAGASNALTFSVLPADSRLRQRTVHRSAQSAPRRTPSGLGN